MRILQLLILLVLLSFGSTAQPYQASPTRDFDLLHSDIYIKPNWQNETIAGKASLTLTPYFYEQNSVSLQAKNYEVDYVKLNGKTLAYFEYDSVNLKIPFEETLSSTDTILVEISYTAHPSREKDSNRRGFYFVQKPQQIWTQGQTSYNSAWFPTLDQANEKHTHSVAIEVPSTMKTLSNGLLIRSERTDEGTRIDYWEQKLVNPVYLTVAVAGNFAKVVDTTFPRFEVSYYVEPAYEKDALAIFGNTPEMIDFFEQLLGVKYPWDKYAQVIAREYISGAMENTSVSVFGSFVQKHKAQLIDNSEDGIIAHELFHHWFGNYVTCESWANLSLNEGFADYAEFLWTSHKYGKSEAQWLQLNAKLNYLRESEEKQLPVIRYQYDDEETLFDSHTYAKGGRILHMLRKLVGDKAFFTGLNIYLTQHAFGTVEIHDLRQAMEQVTGLDLNWFFNQWWLQPGHPDLYVEHAIKGDKLEVYIEQMNTRKDSSAWQFPLEILIETADGQRVEKAWIDESETYLEFPISDSLEYIYLDPEGSLLAEIEHLKPNAMLANQYKKSNFLLPRWEAFRKLTYIENEGDEIVVNPLQNDLIREVVVLATEDPAWQIRDAAVQKLFDYDGPDFLKIEKQLQSLIATDTRAQVRASSILAMKNFLNPQNDLLFRRALKDSSYLVVGAALESILANNPPDADSLATAYRDYDDVTIFGSVANHIATQGRPDDCDWFITKLNQLENVQLYQVLGTFGSYLVSTDVETQEKAVPFLTDLGINNPNWFIRFQAGQTLLLISESELANQAFKKVKAAEKNENALKLYEQFDY